MKDQAQGLRERTWTAAIRGEVPLEGPPVLVVGSGKGGVGKSVLSVLVAAAIAREGYRTLLVDGAQNQGNLHILLGMRPAGTLAGVLAGEVAPHHLVVPVSDALDVLPADSGAEALYALGPVDRARLHQRLSAAFDAYDAVVVDGGPGIEGAVRTAGIRASRLAVVAAPEPASLADAYALIKMVHLQVPAVPIEVMVNRASADEEGQAVFDRLQLAAERFLRRQLGYLGCVPEDDGLRAAARTPGALLGARSGAIDAIAAGFVVRDLRAPAAAIPVDASTRGRSS